MNEGNIGFDELPPEMIEGFRKKYGDHLFAGYKTKGSGRKADIGPVSPPPDYTDGKHPK